MGPGPPRPPAPAATTGLQSQLYRVQTWAWILRTRWSCWPGLESNTRYAQFRNCIAAHAEDRAPEHHHHLHGQVEEEGEGQPQHRQQKTAVILCR